MIRYENECVDCGFPCYDCRYRRQVKHLYCDTCGQEVDTLYWVDGDQVCKDCALDILFDQLEEVTEE